MTKEEMQAAEDAKRQPVKAIYGHEPLRADEYPASYMIGGRIGSGGEVVERIEFREDNFGDHGLGWYDVFANGRRVLSMQSRAVAEVHYSPPPPPPAGDWGCDYCRNDGPLNRDAGTPRCPRCDAEYPFDEEPGA